MKTSTIVWIVVIIIVLAGGWWWFSQPAAPAPSTSAGLNGSPNQGNLGGTDTGTPQQPQGDGTSVAQNLILGASSNASLGQFLTAYNGMTVYTYSPDTKTPGSSSCTGTCAANWPPYTVPSTSAINVSAAITGKVATITRADGSLQVTYNGKPLYFYVKDTKTGDVVGQGVGGVWYVVKP